MMNQTNGAKSSHYTFLLLLLVAVAALWDLWALIIAGFTQHGGFLSFGELITWRTPVTIICVLGAYFLGRRAAARSS